MRTVGRIARLVVAAAGAVLCFTRLLSRLLSIILGWVAAGSVAIGLLGFCTLYLPSRFSANRVR